MQLGCDGCALDPTAQIKTCPLSMSCPMLVGVKLWECLTCTIYLSIFFAKESTGDALETNIFLNVLGLWKCFLTLGSSLWVVFYTFQGSLQT